MEELRLSASQYILLGTFIGAVLGFLFGLIPYIVGTRRGHKKLGTWALVASTISGLVSGIISLVVVAVFLVMIIRNPAPQTPEADQSATDSEKV